MATYAFTAWDFEQPATKQVVLPTPASVGTSMLGVGAGVQARRFNQAPASVFSQLVQVLATDAGADWKGFDGIAGIVWRDCVPQVCLDVMQLDRNHIRTATFTLSGFGEAELPDFGADARAAVRVGNEGESSLTVYGDSEAVHEVVIVKYYPSEDVCDILCRQMLETAKLEPIDLSGLVGYDRAGVLYMIRFSDGGSVFASVSCEEGGRSGPGFTTFVLTRDDPRQRVGQMRCREE